MFCFSSRRRHTRCALVTGVQTCALPICLARAYGWMAANDRLITAHNVWATLAHRDVALPHKVRRLLRDHVLAGDAVWEEARWLVFLEALLPLFSPHPDRKSTRLNSSH